MDAQTPLACSELRLRQFRNFAHLDLSFPHAGVVLIGENGAGKTNLLEALYYLEIFRSFRGVPDERLVRFGADAFHVRGTFTGSADREVVVSAGYEPRTRRKRVLVDDVAPDRIGDAIGRVGAAIFSPSDLALVAGAPAERRRFLDIVLSLNRRGYLGALQRYRSILRQRNAALRQALPGAAIEAWDEGLIDSGTRIIMERAAWVSARGQAFTDRYVGIGDGASAYLLYRPSFALEEGCSQDDIASSFRAELERCAARERDRATTIVGPHRDTLVIRAEQATREADLRDFGSGGQQRTAAIALRMVEAETIKEARGHPPMILLDDVFAELDPGRSRRIFQMFEAEGHGQVILTAPKLSDVQQAGATDFSASLDLWRIADGSIST